MKFQFHIHIENISLPRGLPPRLSVRIPSRQVSDILHVVREVWGFQDEQSLELWLGAQGNPQRRRMFRTDYVDEGEDVWIRGVPATAASSEEN